MRLFRLLIALACLAAGIAVGGLNTQAVQLDLGFAQLPTSLGVAVLVALLLGVVMGGLALAASVVLPLRQRLRRVESARPVHGPGSTGVESTRS
jgi:lipopolysaccharide assembly protein A